jgi:hypothetical protein
LFRTLDAFVKIRQTCEKLDSVVLASIDECVPVTAKAVDPDSQIDPASAADSIHAPIDSSTPIAETGMTEPVDPHTQPSYQPFTTIENLVMRNELSWRRGGTQPDENGARSLA